MRSVFLALASVLVLTAPLFAQEGGPQRPPWFSQEDYGKWMEIQQKLTAAFGLKDYKSGIELLDEELKLLHTVKESLESGKTELPPHENVSPEQIRDAGVRDLMERLAGCWYNKACCFSMTGEKEPAVEALRRSIEHGYADLEHIRADSDLDPIREDPAFKAALGLLDYNDVCEVHVPEGLGEEPAPLLVVLHSAKSNEANIIKGFSELADKYKMILLAPRAPITVGTMQYEWKSYTAGKGAGLRKVAESIAAVKAKHAVDGTRIYLLGARQGGELAVFYAITHPDQVAGAVQMNSYWNKFDYNKPDQLTGAGANGVKIYVIHGKEDPFYAKAEEAVSAFSKAGLPAELRSFEGGREFPPKEEFFKLIEDALDWLIK